MTLKHQKKVCVFDLDGTLVDSMGGFADIASSLISQHYSLPLDKARQEYFRTSGLPFELQLEEIFPKNSQNKSIAAIYEAEKLKNYFEAPLFEGVAETLVKLREKGLKSVLSSNNQEDFVAEYLRRNLPFTLDLVLGYRQVFAKGPSHFDFILKQLGCEKEGVLFVGDSLHDAQIAIEYGVDFAGKLGTFKQEDFNQLSSKIHTIPQMKDLLQLICR